MEKKTFKTKINNDYYEDLTGTKNISLYKLFKKYFIKPF